MAHEVVKESLLHFAEHFDDHSMILSFFQMIPLPNSSLIELQLASLTSLSQNSRYWTLGGLDLKDGGEE